LQAEIRGEGEEWEGHQVNGLENFEPSIGEGLEEDDEGIDFGVVIGDEGVGDLFDKLPKEFSRDGKEIYERLRSTLEGKNGKIFRLGKELEKGKREIRGLRDRNEGYESLNIKYDKVLDELYQKDQEVSSYMDAIEERDRKLRCYEESEISTKIEA
jgi:hypothetical protein